MSKFTVSKPPSKFLNKKPHVKLHWCSYVHIYVLIVSSYVCTHLCEYTPYVAYDLDCFYVYVQFSNLSYIAFNLQILNFHASSAFLEKKKHSCRFLYLISIY